LFYFDVLNQIGSRLRACKKSLLVSIAALLLVSPSFAVHIQNLPFVSAAHLGVVSGIGTGLSLGFSAGISLNNWKIGPEFEQIITDVDYSAAVNAKRLGAVLSVELMNGLVLNLHLGSFGFQVTNRDAAYRSGGNDYLLLADHYYSGQYEAVSADYLWNDFLITPKLAINAINGQGTLSEFDLNLGRYF